MRDVISAFNVELTPGPHILACDSWELRAALEFEVLLPSPYDLQRPQEANEFTG